MVGAKRRALHAAEHSSKLSSRDGRTHARAPETTRDLPDRQERVFPDDLASRSHSRHDTAGAPTMAPETDSADGKQRMDGCGVSDPGAIAWGEVGRRKPRVAHAPVPCTDTSAHWQRAAKNAARSVSTITAKLCITSSSLAR